MTGILWLMFYKCEAGLGIDYYIQAFEKKIEGEFQERAASLHHTARTKSIIVQTIPTHPGTTMRRMDK